MRGFSNRTLFVFDADNENNDDNARCVDVLLFLLIPFALATASRAFFRYSLFSLYSCRGPPSFDLLALPVASTLPVAVCACWPPAPVTVFTLAPIDLAAVARALVPLCTRAGM